VLCNSTVFARCTHVLVSYILLTRYQVCATSTPIYSYALPTLTLSAGVAPAGLGFGLGVGVRVRVRDLYPRPWHTLFSH
jgi:hypothetical protein